MTQATFRARLGFGGRRAVAQLGDALAHMAAAGGPLATVWWALRLALFEEDVTAYRAFPPLVAAVAGLPDDAVDTALAALRGVAAAEWNEPADERDRIWQMPAYWAAAAALAELEAAVGAVHEQAARVIEVLTADLGQK